MSSISGRRDEAPAGAGPPYRTPRLEKGLIGQVRTFLVQNEPRSRGYSREARKGQQKAGEADLAMGLSIHVDVSRHKTRGPCNDRGHGAVHILLDEKPGNRDHLPRLLGLVNG